MFGSIFWAGLFVFGVPYILGKPPRRLDEAGRELDPVGSTRLKNFIGWLMAKIAKYREHQKFAAASSLLQIERFHEPEAHEFFNESHYYNGCEGKSRDRIITRISRCGIGGKKSYVFLLIDSTEHGELALEIENVPSNLSIEDPSAEGLTFTLIEPMNQWRLTFKGKMRKKCISPKVNNIESVEDVQVEIDLKYTRNSPIFWYMRNDCAETLGKNLSQEYWGTSFVKSCLNRTKNHGHYEDFGPLTGHITVDGKRTEYEFQSFRDHSWDIRRWQAIDNLFIVLLAFEKPLRIYGHDYYYLDLTLVYMPGNSSGVSRYSTGYIMPNKADGETAIEARRAPILSLTCGTSIRDIPCQRLPDGRRHPEASHSLLLYFRPEPLSQLAGYDTYEVPIRIEMHGQPRRLQYYPENHSFEVYEDCVHTSVTQLHSKQTVGAYGTRQSGYRVGEYDPTTGGCG